MNKQAEEIAGLMKATREATLHLFDMASEEDLHQSPGYGFRPIMWHLAHIGVFEAYWILQKLKGEDPPDERYERIFDPISTPREQSKNLPSRREMEQYLAGVRTRTLDCLAGVRLGDNGNDIGGDDDDGGDPLLHNAYVFHLVLEHEQQHHETLAYLLHLLDPQKKIKPREETSAASLLSTQPQSLPAQHDMVVVPDGSFEMGAIWNAFAYDNELPAHTVHVPTFKIDRLLTTNEEYREFIEQGGYERRQWWSNEGWEWREREGWNAPLYWSKSMNGGGGNSKWHERTMFSERMLDPQHPVCGVSWYEAEAYARFSGKRLPTEAEWEKAASSSGEGGNRKRRFAWGDENPSPARCNFGEHFWETTPVGSFPQGASFYGCLDMTGNVWEWTSDAFAGYPGFKAFPYPEYSEIWFDEDHRVLKGGSWATGESVLRTSFRNFFRRHFRIAFAGIRCAADA